MMMTSGEKVHYNGMVDCGRQIIKAEGVASLFKGAGANILRGVAGAGVLSMYDKLQELLFGKVVSTRSSAFVVDESRITTFVAWSPFLRAFANYLCFPFSSTLEGRGRYFAQVSRFVVDCNDSVPYTLRREMASFESDRWRTGENWRCSHAARTSCELYRKATER